MHCGAWCGRDGSRMTPFMRCGHTWRAERSRGVLHGSTYSPISVRVVPWRRARKADGRWSIPLTWTDIADNSKSRGCVAIAERHGVVTRETMGLENIAGGFSAVYDVLKALEESGRCDEDILWQG